MKVTLNRTMRVGANTIRRGVSVTMDEGKAKELLARGLVAEAAEPKKPAPKPKAD